MLHNQEFLRRLGWFKLRRKSMGSYQGCSGTCSFLRLVTTASPRILLYSTPLALKSHNANRYHLYIRLPSLTSIVVTGWPLNSDHSYFHHSEPYRKWFRSDYISWVSLHLLWSLNSHCRFVASYWICFACNVSWNRDPFLPVMDICITNLFNFITTPGRDQEKVSHQDDLTLFECLSLCHKG